MRNFNVQLKGYKAVDVTQIPAVLATYEQLLVDYAGAGLERDHNYFRQFQDPVTRDVVGVDFRFWIEGKSYAQLPAILTAWEQIVNQYGLDDTVITLFEEQPQ